MWKEGTVKEYKEENSIFLNPHFSFFQKVVYLVN